MILPRRTNDEYVFSVDQFNKPRQLNTYEKMYTFLVRLFLLEPGTFQSNPTMGIGLISRYRYGDETDIEQLKQDAKEQISTFLPGLESVDVNVEIKDERNLYINITINGIVYRFNYDSALQSITDNINGGN